MADLNLLLVVQATAVAVDRKAAEADSSRYNLIKEHKKGKVVCLSSKSSALGLREKLIETSICPFDFY